MIEINTNQNTLDKFNNYLKCCIDDLTKTLAELTKSIAGSIKIKSIQETSSIADLLELKEFVLHSDPSLASEYQIIEYFGDNASLVVPQVSRAKDNIMKVIKTLNGKDVKELEERVKSIETTIKDINNYLNGAKYNVKTISDLVDSSNIQIDEQIEVLTYLAYSNSPSIEDIKKTDKPKVSSKTKYDRVLAEAKEILVNYFGVLVDKNAQEMKDIINVSQIVGNMNLSDIASFYSEQTVFEGLVYKIKNLIIDLGDAVKNNQENKDELYSELVDAINSIGTFTVEKVIDLVETPNNILFLLDGIGNPLFSINYDQGELAKVGALVTKLLDASGVITNGRLIQDPWLEANKIKAYVKSFGDMFCSYLKTSDNKILIVDFAPKNTIYDETKNIIKKNYSRILEIMELVRINDVEFYAMQKAFLDDFQNNMNGGGR